jgi:hypothetical protein
MEVISFGLMSVHIHRIRAKCQRIIPGINALNKGSDICKAIF